MTERHVSIIGAAVALVLAACAFVAIGRIYSDAKAIDLIDQLSKSALYFGSAIATSSATTLALMLTAVGMANRVDAEFDHRFYRNIYHISVLSTITLVGSMTLLFALTLPVGEFQVGKDWFVWLYQGLFAIVALLSATFVAMVLLVFSTLRAVITNITPSQDV